ncbi:MAG: M24 family metallopeptidase [Planctomycetota bacterium]
MATYTADEIEGIARAGAAVDRALHAGVAALGVGVTTAAVGRAVGDALDRAGARSATLGYPGPPDQPEVAAFGGVCCVCVNDEVLHGAPGDRVLQSGDLVTIDVAASLDGWFADAAVTRTVGSEVSDLERSARAVLSACLEAGQAGERWSAVARAGHAAAEQQGVRLVPGYAGHGIGRALHEPPAAPFFAKSGTPIGSPISGVGLEDDFTLEVGQILTLEPIVTRGSGELVTDADGWLVRTADGAAACYEERTVAVTRNGFRTLSGCEHKVVRGRERDPRTDRA